MLVSCSAVLSKLDFILGVVLIPLRQLKQTLILRVLASVSDHSPLQAGLHALGRRAVYRQIVCCPRGPKLVLLVKLIKRDKELR